MKPLPTPDPGRPGRWPRRLCALGLAAVAAAGCDGSPFRETTSSNRGFTGPTRTWAVSPEPVLRIGVLSGEDVYQLHRVTSVARLPEGGVVVANSGSGELRFFDGEGRYLRSSGRRGDGPGEWRGPDRVRLLGGDTVLVLDGLLRREGLVGLDGAWLGGSPMRDDVLFPSEQWLHGRLLVEGPLRPEERGVLETALDRLDAGGGVVRLARVTPGGRIWTTAWAAADGPVDWTVHDLEGRQVARLTTPPGFEVHDQGEDWVLGVARDSLDVEYVHLLPLDRGGGGYDPGGLARAVEASAGPATTFPRVASGTLPDISASVKQLATLQEIHYSRAMTYSASLDTLASGFRPAFRLSAGLAFEPLRAGSDGWMGRVVRSGGREGCMISYGRFRIIGVTNGSVICWTDPVEAATATN